MGAKMGGVGLARMTPTCDIRSLLAAVVIENTKHECAWVGCSEVVPHSEYRSHQEQCGHRLVSCPGGVLPGDGDHDVSFCGLENHIKTCAGFHRKLHRNSDVVTFNVENEDVGKKICFIWATASIKVHGEIFFL